MDNPTLTFISNITDVPYPPLDNASVGLERVKGLNYPDYLFQDYQKTDCLMAQEYRTEGGGLSVLKFGKLDAPLTLTQNQVSELLPLLLYFAAIGRTPTYLNHLSIDVDFKESLASYGSNLRTESSARLRLLLENAGFEIVSSREYRTVKNQEFVTKLWLGQEVLPSRMVVYAAGKLDTEGSRLNFGKVMYTIAEAGYGVQTVLKDGQLALDVNYKFVFNTERAEPNNGD
jgi:hypothetical protein